MPSINPHSLDIPGPPAELRAEQPSPTAHPSASPPPAVLSTTPNVPGLVHALRRRWLIALCCGVPAALVTVVVVWFLPALSSANAYALVKVSSSQAKLWSGSPDNPVDYERLLKTQAALVRNRAVLEAALRMPQVAELPLVVSKGDGAIEWLERDLSVETTQGSEIIRIVLKGDQTEQLAVIVSAIAKAYLEESRKREIQDRQERVQQLAVIKDQQTNLVGQRRLELAQLQGPTDPQDPTGITRLRTAQEALSRAETDLLNQHAEISTLQLELDAKTGKDGVPSEYLLQDALIDEQVEERLKKDPKSQEMLERIPILEQAIAQTERVAVDPKTQSARYRNELEKLNTELDARRKELWGGVVRAMLDKARAESRVAINQLKSRLDLLKQTARLTEEKVKALREEVRLTKSPTDDVQKRDEIERKKAEVEREERYLNRISTELSALRGELNSPTRAQLHQDGTVAPRDTKRQVQMAAISGCGVFGLLVFGIALWEFRARRVSALDEVSQGLGIRLLGTVPRLPARIRSRLGRSTAPEDLRWQGIVQESVDMTRAMILHAAQTERLQVVMVTSATEGEGKTSLASQLAASLARAGRKTVLLDGDLRKPAAHRLFDAPLEPGFSELLRGEVHLSDVIRPTSMSRLWLIPAGVWNAHATQALAQEPVQSLFEELRGQYDFVVVDSSPVLPVADTLLVAQNADAVLFSILRDESRLPKVYSAYQRLAALGVPMLGAVLSGADGEVYYPDYGKATKG